MSSAPSSQAFIHLHLHSEYSIIDGLIRIDDLIATTRKHGSIAVALTDQSNLFAAVKFYQAALAQGIKPILGAEIWVENCANPNDPFRMVLLCQNEMGYRNLIELISKSYIEGQAHGKPIIARQWLFEQNAGLIVISPSSGGDISIALENDQLELANQNLAEWKNIFEDRLYLEVTRLSRPLEEENLKKLVRLAHETDTPLVATNNARFIKKEDFEAHEARVCIHEGFTIQDPARVRNATEEQYLKSPQLMSQLFNDLPEALENSVEIAKRCNLEMKLGQVFLPNYPVPSGMTTEAFLLEEAKKGLKERLASMTLEASEYSVYTDRLETEVSVINSMGFAGYFLIVADFIRWATVNGVPVGPGRGSGAGSLVAYALKITGLDPLKYELLFERFLNPERVSLPDFDIDFCMEGRDRVIEYVANTYGRGSVSQIITFGTMAAKAVIRDVGRVLGHPYGFVDKIAKLIPTELGIRLEKALEREEALKSRYQEEEEVRLLIDLAMKLEGITRNAGKHAGGVVIAPRRLSEFTPLYCDAEEGVLLSQFDKDDVEAIGLVKFDFLGLRTLTIIDWAQTAINSMRAKKSLAPINIDSIPLDDGPTFDLLRSCNTTAVFQLESRGMKDLVRRLKPDNFEEIVALVALFRPGPLQSGMVDDFINRKHKRAPIEDLHPSIASVLEPTYGIILYQEQVMQIAQILAGYTLGAADLLRRAMGKKKPEEMAKQRAIFTQGAVERGVDERIATYIFDLMEKFAGYGFNKSHSAAYAVLTYQTAWLKTHYPAAFMAAVLSSDMAHTDKIVIFIEECRQLKIPVSPPDVNVSQYKFTADEEGRIRFGLGAIKGVGEAAISSLIEARTSSPFRDIFDLCMRVDQRRVSRRTLEALIRSGAMDNFGYHRAQLMVMLEDALLASEQLMKNQAGGQVDLFGGSLGAADLSSTVRQRTVPHWSRSMLFEGEKETLGFYFSGHPLEEFEVELQQLTTTKIHNLNSTERRVTLAGLIINIRTLNTRKGDRMAFISLDDRTGRQEIAIFSDLYRLKRDLLVKDSLVLVEGELSPDEYTGGLKMRGQNIFTLEEARSRAAKFLKIQVNSQGLSQDFTERLLTTLHIAKGGSTAVRVFYQEGQAQSVLKLGDEWRIYPKQSLIQSLKEMCGDEAIEFCY